MSRTRMILISALLAPLASCGTERTDEVPPRGFEGRAGVVEIEPEEAGFDAVAGQTLYVPSYSSAHIAHDARRFQLSAMLCIRNADLSGPIVVTRVDYFDQDGRLVREFLRRPLRLAPLASIVFSVAENDVSGGTSPGFLVEWSAGTPAADPIVEAVMLGTAGTQGISFISPARVLADRAAGDAGRDN